MTDLAERLLVVGKQNQPTGSAPKGEVWQKGLIHRVMWGLIFSPKGDVLIQHRATDKVLYPGCKDVSWAGHVAMGEQYDQAARREAKEELGLEDFDLELLGVQYSEATFDATPPVGRVILRKFGAVYKTQLPELPTDLQPEEVASVEWWRPEQVKQFVQEYPEHATDGLLTVAEHYL